MNSRRGVKLRRYVSHGNSSDMRKVTTANLLTLIATLSLSACFFGHHATSGANLPDDPAFAQLKQRPLTLPVIRAGDRCPVTRGSRESVPREPYIFCAGCLWFGKGPVYFAWAWNFQVGGRVIDALSNEVEDATFSLQRVPHENSDYRAKTSWVSKPDYSGPILIRGRRLDGKGTLRFSQGGSEPEEDLHLNAPSRTDSTRWSFWPSSMYVPGPGCYGVQVDALRGTDIVIFSAAPGN